MILLALLAGCERSPDTDLQYVKQARSIAAEWLLINQQFEKGKLTATYVSSMHRWLRDGLQTANSSLTRPEAAYAEEIRALLAEPPNAPASRLQAHAKRLKQIEDGLESA